MRSQSNGPIIGVVLLVVGAAILLLQVLPVDAGGLLWPFFVLIPGLAMLFAGVLLGRQLSALVIPGSIVTAIGTILLYQSISGRFETWAYVWGLIPAAVGVGLYLQGRFVDDPELRSSGRTVSIIGLALFVGFGLFFELFVFRGFVGGWFGRLLIPLLLIAAGALVLLRRGGTGSGDGGRKPPMAGPMDGPGGPERPAA